jgi:hypothetical protein
MAFAFFWPAGRFLFANQVALDFLERHPESPQSKRRRAVLGTSDGSRSIVGAGRRSWRIIIS